MKILLLSDSHLAEYPGPTEPDGTSSRLIDIIAAHDAPVEWAVSKGAKALIHVGDLFHRRKAVEPAALHHAGAWLDRVRQRGMDVHVLVGNHDLSLTGNANSVSALHTVTAHNATEVVEIGGIKIGFMPYSHDPEVVRANVAAIAKKKAKILFGHLGIGDPKFSDSVPTDYEVPGRINVDDLRPDDFAHVFLGHYHRYQELTPRLRYVGSPIQLSAKEAGQRKVWLLLDTETMKVTVKDNDVSPCYRIAQSVADIEAAGPRDVVLYRAKNRDDEAEALAMAEGRNLRVERARAEAPTARIDSSLPDSALVQEFLTVRGVTDPARRDRLTTLATRLLHEH